MSNDHVPRSGRSCRQIIELTCISSYWVSDLIKYNEQLDWPAQRPRTEPTQHALYPWFLQRLYMTSSYCWRSRTLIVPLNRHRKRLPRHLAADYSTESLTESHCYDTEQETNSSERIILGPPTEFIDWPHKVIGHCAGSCWWHLPATRAARGRTLAGENIL